MKLRMAVAFVSTMVGTLAFAALDGHAVHIGSMCLF